MGSRLHDRRSVRDYTQVKACSSGRAVGAVGQLTCRCCSYIATAGSRRQRPGSGRMRRCRLLDDGADAGWSDTSKGLEWAPWFYPARRPGAGQQQCKASRPEVRIRGKIEYMHRVWCAMLLTWTTNELCGGEWPGAPQHNSLPRQLPMHNNTTNNARAK